MAAAVPVITAIAGAASVVGTFRSFNAQKEIAADQKKQQQLAVRKQRRQAIREAQFARAQTVASAEASGASDTSSVKGGLGSLGSQLGSELGFSSQMSAISNRISGNAAKANNAQGLASIGSSVFTGLGGFSNFNFGQDQNVNRAPQLYQTNWYNQQIS